MGWLIGYVIAEIILAIFSFGIGTVVKAGAQVFARAMSYIGEISRYDKVVKKYIVLHFDMKDFIENTEQLITGYRKNMH